uniref:PH domain-containing protein n=1 Tax=Heterorhabditis bacteriophora TaxID=37862 RepID=A0A1I7WH38_HETBA
MDLLLRRYSRTRFFVRHRSVALKRRHINDIAETELTERDEEHFSQSDAVTKGNEPVRVIDGALYSQDLKREDGITFTVQTTDRLNPLDRPNTGNWISVWESAENKMKFLEREDRYLRDWDDQMRRILLKRSALHVLLRAVTSQSSYNKSSASRNHIFEYYSASGNQASTCALCHFPLYGTVVRTGNHFFKYLYQNVHYFIELYIGGVVWKYINQGLRTLTMGRVTTPRSPLLHQGYLSKKGAKFKLWAPRWFELDANNHKKMKYLSLQLRTRKRMYCLLAENRIDADTWKEKIEQVLRE